MLNTKFAAALLAATTLIQMSGAAFAENGPWTTNHPFAWGVTSFPLRVVTGGVGAVMGTFAGSVKGIVETEQKFSENTFKEADKNPVMLPVGLVGAAVAIPVGVIVGAPQGAAKAGEAGYKYWDRY